MTSYFQSRVSSLTPTTIASGVNLGPVANFRGSLCPVARIFTLCPPTSTTRTLVAVFCELSVTLNKYYTTEAQRTQSRTADRDREWTRIGPRMGAKKDFNRSPEFLRAEMNADRSRFRPGVAQCRSAFHLSLPAFSWLLISGS